MAQPTADWQEWCRVGQIEVDARSVTYWFGDKGRSRKHVVRITERDNDLLLEATAATARITDLMMEAGRNPRQEAWRRNRTSELVGFRFDNRGRLLVEAVVPKLGLEADEFRFYVHAVATEAGRLELVLTGRDEQ